MRDRLSCLLVVLIAVCGTPAWAALASQQVVVVYNSNTAWSPVSCDVAEYYCDARGVPALNRIGLDVPVTTEQMSPEEFTHFVGDPLMLELESRFGSASTGLATDPIKVIVLCYGIPLRVGGQERTCSVDSALTPLFIETPGVRNPSAARGSTE